MQVLAEEIPALLGNLSFPKTMRWNSQVRTIYFLAAGLHTGSALHLASLFFNFLKQYCRLLIADP
jgi:hypothetical protein